MKNYLLETQHPPYFAASIINNSFFSNKRTKLFFSFTEPSTRKIKNKK